MGLTEQLIQIDKLKSELDSFMPMSEENDRAYWKKIRLDWNFNSNHIEGNTLTYGETQLLIMFDKTTGDHELREYQEMKAHDAAIHMVKEWVKDKNRSLSEKDIRELNRIILVQPYWKEAETYDGQATRRLIKIGEYKEHPNSVRLKNGEIFEYVSPMETPIKMAELVEMYQINQPIHPLIIASQLHYSFIRIHPFDDGNGRVARLLVNYELMKNSYPPIIIKSSEKEKYLTALQKADTGDIIAFHEYMADQLIWSLEIAIKAAKGADLTEPEDFEKEIRQIELMLKNQQKDVLKKTPALVWDAWKKSIWPLCSSLYEKIAKSSGLFTEFEIRVYDDRYGKSVGNKEEYNNVLNEYFGNQNLSNVRLEYNLRGFNTGNAESLFNVYFGIVFQMNDFDYTVDAPRSSSEKTLSIKKLYSEQLSDEEIKMVVHQKSSYVLSEIKDNYKRKTGKEL